MTKAEARDWLERLSVENWDRLNGELILVNIYLCLKKRLIKVADLKSFLDDCLNASPGKTALQQFVEVCQPVSSGRPAYFALKRVKIREVDPNTTLVNVIDEVNFGTYILAPSHVDALKKALPVGIRNEPDEELYDKYLASVGGTDWAIPDAYLGKPAPGQKNCWFTNKGEFDRRISTSTSYPEKANAARDGLGLIQHEKEASLIAITFPGSALHGGTGAVIAEPTFADGINRRYAAAQSGSTYVSNRAGHWGTTADLDKFASKAPEMCGLPERVCSPVPIDPKKFTPKYLGKITENRGYAAHENDEAFSTYLRGSVGKPAMIRFILLKVFP